MERGEPPSSTPKTPETDERETPPTPEIKVSSDELPNEEATGELYPKTRPIQRQLDAGGQVLTLPVPDAPSLREPLALAQALRPLMRRLPTGSEEILDEIATVNRIAEEGIYFPVMQPALEPWLDVALVVDESETMVIWRHTIRQLKRFFEHYGAFRDVRTWGLTTDEIGKVRIQRGIGTIAEKQSAASAAELIDPSGRRLVLVVSDCVGNLWREGKVLPVLETWSNSNPTAILQMLPERMWWGTGLREGTSVRLQGLNPGVANSSLIVTEQLSSPEQDISGGIKLPVLNLEPKVAGIWSQMVAGKGRVTAPGFIFAPAVEGETESSTQEERENGRKSEGKSPESPLISAQEVNERVHRFRMTASPLARRLAELLAAAPMITLPIVRLIQETLLEKSRQVHVAEVFLGGLLQPRSQIRADTNPDEVQYGFIDDFIDYEPTQPKMRELLLEFASDRETLSVIDSVSKYVTSQLRKSLEEFAGLLKAPRKERGGEMEPFARVTATVLKRLGGDYARFAEELEERWYSEKIYLNRETPKIQKKSALQIFLAHATEDREKVRELYHRLKNAGYKPWLDVEDLIAGQNWRQEIPKAISNSQIFLACLSQASIAKRGFVQKEFRMALNQAAALPPDSIYLIPIRLDECEIPNLRQEEYGLNLRDIHWLDYWEADGFDKLEKAISYLSYQYGPFAQERHFTEDLGNGIKLEIIAIPGGKFLMGSPEGEGGDDEKPQHEVTVSPFFIGKFQVTQTQWRAIASLPQIERDLNPDPSWFKGDDRPVENISWFDAVEFCQRLSKQTGTEYRLPSEAEWEYACRAGTTTPFHFGATITSDLANYRGSSTYANEPKGEFRQQTTPVGSFPPNAFGLYDMHGNVWEWCEDDWYENYQGAPTDGSARVSGFSSFKVARGVSWNDIPWICRSALRYNTSRDYRTLNIGVRVVCVASRTT